jgi:hypothetical protein
MCSATGYPVAERPAYTRGENRFSTIVPSLAVTGCSSINSRREFINWSAAQWDGRFAAHSQQGEERPHRVSGRTIALEAARALGLELIVLNATNDEEIDQADAA